MPLCASCNEPWSSDYLNHEGVDDNYDSPNAPQAVVEESTKLIDFKDQWIADNVPSHIFWGSYEARGYRADVVKAAREAGVYPDYPSEFFKAVTGGKGCPACGWSTATDPDKRLETVRHLIMDSRYDGDPADVIMGLF